MNARFIKLTAVFGTCFVFAWLFSNSCFAQEAGFRDGSPLESLPSHIRQLTTFGERPDWRHDGKRILFLSKVFGDVYEYEIESGKIFPCTDHFRHYGFTRALYLSNGDLLLCGPTANFDRMDKDDRQRARSSCFMSVLDKSFSKPPVPLNTHCDEGPAVSRSALRIAWTHGKQDRISTGEIFYKDGVPELKNTKLVLSSGDFPEKERPRQWIETQNFIPPDDTKLTVTAYEINVTNTETFVVDLKNGSLTNMTRSPGHYEECEGIFPDGEYTTVERAANPKNPWPLIDIYKLKLDGSGETTRLTYFTEYRGYKGGESVVSDDGKYMLFTLGKSGMEAGQGFGLLLLDLDKFKENSQ